MFRKALVVVMLVVIPVTLSARVIDVSSNLRSIIRGVIVADAGDTLRVEGSENYQQRRVFGKNIIVGYDALEPEDAEPDSTIYGPNDPFPATPVE